MGELTSGTTVPAWVFEGDALGRRIIQPGSGPGPFGARSVESGREVEVAYRKRVLAAKIVPSFTKPGPVFLTAQGVLKPAA